MNKFNEVIDLEGLSTELTVTESSRASPKIPCMPFMPTLTPPKAPALIGSPICVVSGIHDVHCLVDHFLHPLAAQWLKGVHLLPDTDDGARGGGMGHRLVEGFLRQGHAQPAWKRRVTPAEPGGLAVEPGGPAVEVGTPWKTFTLILPCGVD